MKLKIITKIFREFLRDEFNQRYKKDDKGLKNTLTTEEYERCVMCGAMTTVTVSTPIDWRENYEIGIGQICDKCAKKQRELIEYENMLSDSQIMFAVDQSEKEKNNL